MESKHIIINVGRQVCAGGLEIGRLLAEEFHAKYYDRELLNLAARESGFSEEFLKRSDERKGFFRTILHLPGASTMDGDSFYQNNFSQESLFKFQSDAIIKAAQESSCVFVGRASYYNYYTGKKWGHAASYDLCVDSSILGAEETARLIAEFIHKRFKI